MSVTFIKKNHTCNSCGNKGNTLCAIKTIGDISTNYPKESIPQDLKNNGIYIEEIIRNDFGLTISRTVKEQPCSACGQFTLTEDHKDSDKNVLNFYPPTEAHKWLDGFAKAGM